MATSATPVQLVNPDTGVPYAVTPATPAATDASNNRRVVGDSAAGTADSGSSPVKIGGVVTTTLGFNADGTRVDLLTDSRRQLRVALPGATSTPADGGTQVFLTYPPGAGSGTAFTLGVLNYYWNGAANVIARGDTNGAFSVSKGGSTIATGQVPVTTSSTQIVPARAGRQKITLSPTSSTVYYVGVSGVTSTTGLYVPAGGTITLDTAAAVFAVGSAALTVSYVEFF